MSEDPKDLRALAAKYLALAKGSTDPEECGRYLRYAHLYEDIAVQLERLRNQLMRRAG